MIIQFIIDYDNSIQLQIWLLGAFQSWSLCNTQIIINNRPGTDEIIPTCCTLHPLKTLSSSVICFMRLKNIDPEPCSGVMYITGGTKSKKGMRIVSSCFGIDFTMVRTSLLFRGAICQFTEGEKLLQSSAMRPLLSDLPAAFFVPAQGGDWALPIVKPKLELVATLLFLGPLAG